MDHRSLSWSRAAGGVAVGQRGGPSGPGDGEGRGRRRLHRGPLTGSGGWGCPRGGSPQGPWHWSSVWLCCPLLASRVQDAGTEGLCPAPTAGPATRLRQSSLVPGDTRISHPSIPCAVLAHNDAERMNSGGAGAFPQPRPFRLALTSALSLHQPPTLPRHSGLHPIHR